MAARAVQRGVAIGIASAAAAASASHGVAESRAAPPQDDGTLVTTELAKSEVLDAAGLHEAAELLKEQMKASGQLISTHSEDGTEWLRADVSIECHTVEHDRVKWIAWVAVAIYPVGMWLLNFFLLRRAGPAILNGYDTRWRTATSFLHQDYVPERYWWELCEMARRCAHPSPAPCDTAPNAQ